MAKMDLRHDLDSEIEMRKRTHVFCFVVMIGAVRTALFRPTKQMYENIESLNHIIEKLDVP